VALQTEMISQSEKVRCYPSGYDRRPRIADPRCRLNSIPLRNRRLGEAYLICPPACVWPMKCCKKSVKGERRAYQRRQVTPARSKLLTCRLRQLGRNVETAGTLLPPQFHHLPCASTRNWLSTENTPGTPFARTPTTFLSIMLATTPFKVTWPLSTMI